VKREGLVAVCLALALGACNGKVSREECTQMLDKYLDMSIAGELDPSETLSQTEMNAAREMKKALRKSDAAYRRVQDQCEREVSRSEYRCAMKSTTPETWQACID
jgi:hypothetical protein